MKRICIFDVLAIYILNFPDLCKSASSLSIGTCLIFSVRLSTTFREGFERKKKSAD